MKLKHLVRAAFVLGAAGTITAITTSVASAVPGALVSNRHVKDDLVPVAWAE